MNTTQKKVSVLIKTHKRRISATDNKHLNMGLKTHKMQFGVFNKTLLFSV